MLIQNSISLATVSDIFSHWLVDFIPDYNHNIEKCNRVDFRVHQTGCKI